MSKLSAREQVLVKIHQVVAGTVGAASIGERSVVPKFLKYLAYAYPVIIDNQGEGFYTIVKRSDRPAKDTSKLKPRHARTGAASVKQTLKNLLEGHIQQGIRKLIEVIEPCLVSASLKNTA